MPRDPRTRAGSCDGKRRWESFALAERARIYNKRRWHSVQTIYHCRFCQGWHTGHSTGRRKRPEHTED